MKEKFSVKKMSCSACVARVEKTVSALHGVSDVSVNLLSNSMMVEYNESVLTSKDIAQAVTRAGYPTKKASGAEKRNEGVEKTLVFRIGASLILLFVIMFVSMSHMLSYPLPDVIAGEEKVLLRTFIQFSLTLIVLLLNKAYFINGFKSLFRAPNMDSLIALGASASFIYGTINLVKMYNFPSKAHILEHSLYFEGAAMIVTLVTIGKMLEAKSRRKTGEALSRLIDMTPKTAVVERDGEQISIPVEKLQVGDIIIIKAGESIGADAEVVFGEGEVDQSCITGESLPVSKNTGDSIIGTTMLKSGFLKARVTHTGKDSVFSRIIELVDSAQTSKAPIARLADKIAGIFVPVVITISIITFAVWILATKDVGSALNYAISVLVISCPCALGLATPVAITTGTGRGAECGILIKSAEILEELHLVDVVVFDKTGTITNGTPAVVDVLPLGMSERELVLMAASIEKQSEHPLSYAIVKYAEESGICFEECVQYKTLQGKGVSALWRTKLCLGGNEALMKEHGINTDKASCFAAAQSEEGKTPLYFSCDGVLCGVIAVSDTIKSDSKKAIEHINALGLETVMLTGDNHRSAQSIAKNLGLSRVISDVLPEDKERVIRELQKAGRRVAMVGDGINDAPSLARANIGFAIGGGSDIARDSADIVLMTNSLVGVYDAIRLSRKTIKNIKENLFWAFFYNCLGIPLAAGALVPLFNISLSPMIASLFMSLSSIIVVTNALRLRKFKKTD